MTQYARPDTDITTSTWLKSGGTYYYENVDEAAAGDSDYVYLTSQTSQTLELRLSDVTDPVSSSSHKITFRIKRVLVAAGTGYLMQGSTQICSVTLSPTTDYADTTYTLSSSEADAITDYSDLRLQIVATANNASRFFYCSQMFFECPDAPVASVEVNESDGVTVGESVGRELPIGLMPSAESVTVGDQPVARLDLAISAADFLEVIDREPIVAVVEGGVVDLTVSVQDGVGVGESAVASHSLSVSKSDGATVGESRAVSPVLEISRSDSAGVGESRVVSYSLDISESEAVGTGENRIVNLSTLEINKADGVTTGEYVEGNVVAVGGIEINKSESVTLGENVAAGLGINVSKSESVNTGEEAQARPTLSVSETDGAVVGEYSNVVVSAAGAIEINKSESVTVGESAQARWTLNISEIENIGVTDAGQAALAIRVSVSDSVTMGESRSVQPVISISATQAVTVGESRSVAPLTGICWVTDAVAVGEAVAVNVSLAIAEAEGVTVGESASGLVEAAMKPGRATASDAVRFAATASNTERYAAVASDAGRFGAAADDSDYPTPS